MPKLLYFLACERVITADDGTVSLITLLEKLTLNIPVERESELPENVLIPNMWHAVATYEWEKGDTGKEFEQRLSIFVGEKSVIPDTVSPLSYDPDRKRTRNVVRIPGFPLIPTGEIRLRLALREKFQESEWQQIAEYDIQVASNVGENDATVS